MRFVASEWLLRSMELTKVAAKSMSTQGHVIICGYGRSGQYMARFIEQENVDYVALDLDPERYGRLPRLAIPSFTAMPRGARRWSRPG